MTRQKKMKRLQLRASTQEIKCESILDCISPPRESDLLQVFHESLSFRELLAIIADLKIVLVEEPHTLFVNLATRSNQAQS